MTPLVRNGAILASVLVMGAVTVSVIIMSQSPKPAVEAAAPDVSTAPMPAASSPPDAAFSHPAPSPAAAAPPPSGNADLQFDPLVQRFTLARDSAAYVAANNAAPQMYPLKSGTPLISAAKSRGGAWVVAMTEDGQAAYLPAADLGPYDPSRFPAPDLPAHLAGPATVIDTGTLMVDGQKAPLAGVIGETGDYAVQLQQLIDSHGSTVQCDLQGQAYICTLPPGWDIGRTGLFNGGADLGPDANADYQQQASAAKAAHRGIWK
jgi:hypothetical protein